MKEELKGSVQKGHVILAKNETCQFSSKVHAFEFNQETSPRDLFADFHYDS